MIKDENCSDFDKRDHTIRRFCLFAFFLTFGICIWASEYYGGDVTPISFIGSLLAGAVVALFVDIFYWSGG